MAHLKCSAHRDREGKVITINQGSSMLQFCCNTKMAVKSGQRYFIPINFTVSPGIFQGESFKFSSLFYLH